MPKVVREIGVLSMGKVAGIVYACLGLIVGMIIAFVSLLGGFAGVTHDGGAVAACIAMALSAGAVFVFPLVYGVVGVLVGLLVAVFYNVAARLVGGIELTID